MFKRIAEQKWGLLAGLLLAGAALAGDGPVTESERIVSTLVAAQVACDRGDTAACDKRNTVCRAITPEHRRELFDFIRNDYPYKAKNGAMYVTMKFGKAMRDCR